MGGGDAASPRRRDKSPFFFFKKMAAKLAARRRNVGGTGHHHTVRWEGNATRHCGVASAAAGTHEGAGDSHLSKTGVGPGRPRGTEWWLWRHSGNSHVACQDAVAAGKGAPREKEGRGGDYVAKRHPEREAQKATWHRAMALEGLTQPCKLGEGA